MQHGYELPDRGPLLRALAQFETALAAVSVAAMAGIMLIVVVDVGGRYFFSAPLSWSYNVIGLYLMTAVFFMALPDTLTHHGHIAVDVLQHNLPKPVMHFGLAIGYGMSTVLVALICQGAWARLVKSWVNDEYIQALVPLATWIPYAMVVAGTATLVLRCLVRTIGHAGSALTGRDMVDLPPPPVTSRPGEHD